MRIPIFKARDIHNQRAVHRLEQLSPRSPARALTVEWSRRSCWFMKYTADGDTCATVTEK